MQATKLLDVLRDMEVKYRLDEANCKPDPLHYALVMDAFGRCGEVQNAENLLVEMMKSEDIEPTVICFNSVIKGHAKSKSPDALKRIDALFRKLKQGVRTGDTTIYPSIATYPLVTRAWALSGLPEAADYVHDLFHEVRQEFENGETRVQQMSDMYSNLFLALANSGRLDAVQTAVIILNDMIRKHLDNELYCRPAPFHFSVVIGACGSVGDVANAEKLFERSKELLGMDLYSGYTSALNAFANSSHPKCGERAEAFLRKTRDPNSTAFSLAMKAWLRSGSAGSTIGPIQRLFDEMLQRFNDGNENCRPHGRCYWVLLSAWSRSGREDAGQKALSILNDMEQRHKADSSNPKPRNIEYNSVISAFSRIGDAENAEKVLEKMTKAKDIVDPDEYSYGAVMSSYSRSQLPDAGEKADALLNRLEGGIPSGEKTIYPDTANYLSAVRAWSRSGSPEAYTRAMAVLTRMVERLNKADKARRSSSKYLAVFVEVLLALRSCKDVTDKAGPTQEIVSMMESCNLTPNAMTSKLIEEMSGLTK